MITLSQSVLDRIRADALQSYPEECCGILLGTVIDEAKTVGDLIAQKNSCQENRMRGFLIPPNEYCEAERRSQYQGTEIVGIYHSHPDHPPIPSAFDLERALPVWSYLIITVEQGFPGIVKSWVLKGDRSGFTEEQIHVKDIPVVPM